MIIEAAEAAALAVKSLRSNTWGLAIAVLSNGVTEFVIDPGADELDESTRFQICSVTKTMTGLLLADCVIRGETSLDTRVGDILGGDAGNCADLSLLVLATHHSGLGPMPPNFDPVKIDPRDPYAMYTEADLLEGLRLLPAPVPAVVYSNFGFWLLGLLIARITKTPSPELIRERVGIYISFLQVIEAPERRRSYTGFRATSSRIMRCSTSTLTRNWISITWH